MSLRALAKKLPFVRGFRAAFNRDLNRIAASLQPRGSLVPPKWFFRDPDSVDGSHTPDEFSAGARATLQWLIEHEGLKPTHRFLDVGCGIGRMAIPLAGHLQQGKYHGFDIEKWKIAYCRRTVGHQRPDFAFHHAEVFNKYYNPKGRFRASEYRFPWDDASFDFVLLTSVFTHMLPADMEHYLSEVARVMARGAKCVITHFLFDSKEDPYFLFGSTSDASGPWHSFSDVCRIANRDAPEHGVAYHDRFVRELYAKYGLQIVTLIPGAKRGKPTSNPNPQDIVIALKAD